MQEPQVPPLRFAPVGMTELLREGIAQAGREEFIEEEEMDARIERMPYCDRVLAPELRDYGFRLHTVPLRPVPPPVAVP